MVKLLQLLDLCFYFYFILWGYLLVRKINIVKIWQRTSDLLNSLYPVTVCTPSTEPPVYNPFYIIIHATVFFMNFNPNQFDIMMQSTLI